MNDSFLEDLELLPTEPQQKISSQQINKHVTTREGGASLPLSHLSENNDFKHQYKSKSSSPSVVPSNVKRTDVKQLPKEPRKHSERERDTKKQDVKEILKNKSDKKEKPIDAKSKAIENKMKAEIKEKENREDAKAKIRDIRMKVMESNKAVEKDRNRRSGSHKESSRTSDASSKENSYPLESSVENSQQLQMIKEKKRFSEGSTKIGESKEKDPVALLNAIKDLISSYTKQESTKILRAMQELHINSQANLIKHLLCQTDELVQEMHPSKKSMRIQLLLEENEKLRGNLAILEARNADLQKKMEELEFLKQENAVLKLKCKEL